MAMTRSMTRNHNHDDDALSSRKKSKSCAPWSDLDHNLLLLVMMHLGFGDYYSFSGVCTSWRLLAHSNKNKFMKSRPPMFITIFNDDDEKEWYLEDFQGRKFKTILPDFAGGDCIGLTCGYLIFFSERTRKFWLVNPITRKKLHFPDFPNLYAFKGKIYTLSYDHYYPVVHERYRVCELRLNPEPQFTLLENNNPTGCEFFYPDKFVSSAKNLYVTGWGQDHLNSLRELDLGEMKWVVPCEKTMEAYTIFCSSLNDAAVAVKRESWADPRTRSQSKGRYDIFEDCHNYRKYRFFVAKMWYFPHECMDVDRIDE